jgi:hypothetical protein
VSVFFSESFCDELIRKLIRGVKKKK